MIYNFSLNWNVPSSISWEDVFNSVFSNFTKILSNGVISFNSGLITPLFVLGEFVFDFIFPFLKLFIINSNMK